MTRTLALACALCLPSSAQAQPQEPQLEIGVVALLDGPVSAGTTRAELLDPAGGRLTLFEASHRATRALGAEVRVGRRVGAAWTVDVAAAWSRPGFETRIRGDIEGAAPVTAALGMHRVSLDLGVARGLGAWGRTRPYARLAAGWVRELTADRVLVDDGFAAHVGAGLKYPVREGRPGWLGHVALRAEARLALRRGGITLGATGTRWSPSVAAGLVIAR